MEPVNLKQKGSTIDRICRKRGKHQPCEKGDKKIHKEKWGTAIRFAQGDNVRGRERGLNPVFWGQDRNNEDSGKHY